MLEHAGIGFVFAKFAFESDGVIDAHRQAIPFECPWLKLFGAFVDSFVVLLDFGFGVFSGAYEAAVHTIDEDVNGFHKDGVVLISMGMLVGAQHSARGVIRKGIKLIFFTTHPRVLRCVWRNSTCA